MNIWHFPIPFCSVFYALLRSTQAPPPRQRDHPGSHAPQRRAAPRQLHRGQGHALRHSSAVRGPAVARFGVPGGKNVGLCCFKGFAGWDYSGLLNESLGMYCCLIVPCLNMFSVFVRGGSSPSAYCAGPQQIAQVVRTIIRSVSDILQPQRWGRFPPLQMSILDGYIKGMNDMRNHSQIFLHTKLVT